MKTKAMLILCVVLAAAAAAGGVWWRRASPVPVVVPPPPPPPRPRAPPRLPSEAFCLSLPWREDAYREIVEQGQRFPSLPPVQRWPAPVGLYMDPMLLPDEVITPRWKAHLARTRGHQGHLGCALGHMAVLDHIRDTDRLTLVLEDDVVLQPALTDHLALYVAELDALDPDWTLLLLGFSCSSVHSDRRCDRNLANVEPGRERVDPTTGRLLVRLSYSFGQWAYVVNGARGARRLLDLWPLGWALDLDLHREGTTCRVYGVLPSLAHHPGIQRCEQWDYVQDSYRRPPGRRTYLASTHV